MCVTGNYEAAIGTLMAGDDFPAHVRRVIRDRAGGRCSNPNCTRATTGPSSDPNKANSVGVAAHITANAKKGPRHNELLTASERRSAENGIWVCHACSDLIDKDSITYTVDRLRGWKIQREAAAAEALERPWGQPTLRDTANSGVLDSQFPEWPTDVRITGGNQLGGTITVGAAKNSASKMLIAALMTKEVCIFNNILPLTDVKVVCNAIEILGGQVKISPDLSTIEVNARNISAENLPKIRALDNKSRINILFLSPLLHRFGRAIVPTQGGCNLGFRQVDFHVDILKAMGCKFSMNGGATNASAPKEGLIGSIIRLPKESVGATEQAILAATLAKGITVVKNAALAPEVKDIIRMLNKMGGAIVIDTYRREIRITGVEQLHGVDEYTPMPDRAEVGSWACLSLAAGAEIEVVNANKADMGSFIETFELAGGRVKELPNGLVFSRKGTLKALQAQTESHPGFLTDWQPPLAAALTQADGISVIHETIFDDRLSYVTNLEKMGASIDLHPECLGTVVCQYTPNEKGIKLHSAMITGPSQLKGSDIRINELRGGFACIIAALVAEGETIVRDFGFLAKGYHNLIHKLHSIGAKIEPLKPQTIVHLP